MAKKVKLQSPPGGTSATKHEQGWRSKSPLPGEAHSLGNVRGPRTTEDQSLIVQVSSLFHLGEKEPIGGWMEGKKALQIVL